VIHNSDGVQYNCQAQCEITLSKSLNSSFEVQGCFTRYLSSDWLTVCNGVVIKVSDDLPVVQVSRAREGEPVLLYVDNIAILNGFESEDVVVIHDSATILVDYPQHGLHARITINSVYMNLYLQLPVSMLSEQIVGLLGSPNSVRNDDWMDHVGNSIDMPFGTPGAFLFRPAYEYCRQWCLESFEKSLFVYQHGFDFGSFAFGAKEYNSSVEEALGNVSPEVVAVCGANQACLVDGFGGGVNMANEYIQANKELLLYKEEKGDCFQGRDDLVDTLAQFFVQSHIFFTEVVDTYGWLMNNCKLCLDCLDLFATLLFS
jgi:hypothetical protein